jgi:hypothetical protein
VTCDDTYWAKYRGWDWVVRCYYGDNVRPPRTAGGLAIETVHRGDSSKDVEVAAARSRADIGAIDVLRVPEGYR